MFGVVIAVVLTIVLAGHSTTKKTATGEVLLEGAASTGADPFTSSVASPVPTIAAPAPSFAPVPGPTVTPAPVVLRAETGNTVGLYGGTLNLGQCDAGQMAGFLAANPSKAAAWAQALNSDTTLRWSGGTSVSAAQIPSYLAQLTPVILRADTRVTNNGFVNGQPTPHQSVLQTGTAVLVDTYGVPRARCACGNPLSPPYAVPGGVTYAGTPWPAYSPTTVVVVNPSPVVINTFVLVNINNGTTFNQPVGNQPATQPTTAPPTVVVPPGPTSTVTVTAPPAATPPPAVTPPPAATSTRPPAATPGASAPLTVPPSLTLGTGDVQVTLLWSGDSDEDIHVVDPAGEEISFQHSTSASGGTLDHDEIPGCGTARTTHVENIFWPPGGAPNGGYQAFVVNYGACPNSPPATYELRVTVGGRVVSDTTGTLPQTSGVKSAPVSFGK